MTANAETRTNATKRITTNPKQASNNEIGQRMKGPILWHQQRKNHHSKNNSSSLYVKSPAEKRFSISMTYALQTSHHPHQRLPPPLPLSRNLTVTSLLAQPLPLTSEGKVSLTIRALHHAHLREQPKARLHRVNRARTSTGKVIRCLSQGSCAKWARNYWIWTSRVPPSRHPRTPLTPQPSTLTHSGFAVISLPS